MSHTRRPLGPTEYGILMGCSTCGFSYHYPQEIRRHSDGKWRCTIYCNDPTNDTEDSRLRASAKPTRNENTVRIPGAFRPGYFT